MNKIYRHVWSRVHNALIPVSEIAGSVSPKSGPRQKNGIALDPKTKTTEKSKKAQLARALALLLAGVSPVALALPSGGHVQHGQASIHVQGNNLTVDQGTKKAIINWQKFGIKPNESVNFNQPSLSSITLNRVIGNNPSKIMGHLSANGQIFLVNPSGITFGKNASVDAGGIVASTLNITNKNFLNNDYQFQGNSTNSVINKGSIKTSQGGSVAFIGHQVNNQGQISTPGGTTALGAGQRVDLTLSSNHLLHFAVKQSALKASARNGGLIKANHGGKVVLTAHAKNAALKTVVNNQGVIRAHSVKKNQGHIALLGGNSGTTKVSGTLDASASTNTSTNTSNQNSTQQVNGGTIETSGAHVKIANKSQITTKGQNGGKDGTWTIDPKNFTMHYYGGDLATLNLNKKLSNNNVTIKSSQGKNGKKGNINVDGRISWSSSNNLTLSAYNNINVNSNIKVKGSGQLALYYGQGSSNGVINGQKTHVNIKNSSYGSKTINLSSNASFSTKLGSNGTIKNYTIVDSLGSPGSTNSNTLQGMAASGNLSGNYVLGTNINAKATGTNTNTWGTNGFKPIGSNSSNAFTGTFDGLGHKIKKLHINRPSSDNIGLFGVAQNASIKNLRLTYDNTTGNNKVGGLVGYSSNSQIFNSENRFGGYGTNVSGHNAVGGLIGQSTNSTIQSVETDTSVSGNNSVGGILGVGHGGSITNAKVRTSNTISGSSNIGGLVGSNTNSDTINNAYTKAKVTGSNSNIGGLVGFNSNSKISYSHSKNKTKGANHVGGLVGSNINGSTISHSYVSSRFSYNNVDGSNNDVGGLVGINKNSKLTHDYSHIKVIGQKNTGGLIGFNTNGNIIHTHALSKVKGTTNVGGLVGSNNQSSIQNSYTSNNVASTSNNAGGLVGHNAGSSITNAYATGNITGTSNTNVGGLVGYNANSPIVNAFASGTVKGSNNVGGLVGHNSGSSITNAYATGNVNGTNSNIGGLIGFNNSNSSINSVYADGSVSGSNVVGGLIGNNGTNSSISHAYWDSTTDNVSGRQGVGNATNSHVQSQTTAQLASSLPNGFNQSVWGNAGQQTTPYLMANSNLPSISGNVIRKTDTGSTPSKFDVILNISQLQHINKTGRNQNYVLGQNINASATANWNSNKGFSPIGDHGSSFSGHFDGLNHVIKGLTINQINNYKIGLFGKTYKAKIDNLGLVNPHIKGYGKVGGVVGKNNNTTISNVYISGGLIFGKQRTGGLVGSNKNNSFIKNDHASVNVKSSDNAYYANIGGLVGINNNSTIANSYVAGGRVLIHAGGGLLGKNSSNGTVKNVYSADTVKRYGTNYYSYPNGGSVIGSNKGIVTNVYWDTNTGHMKQAVGNSNSNGITGLSTSALMNTGNLSGFNFTKTSGATGNNWVLVDQNGTLNNTNSASGATLPMLASEYSQTIQNSHQLQLMAMARNANYKLIQNINADNTGNVANGITLNIWGQSGFVPVGNTNNPFTGTLNGQGHLIKGLTIQQPKQSNIGLLGVASNSTIQNIGLTGVDIKGSTNVGGLVGQNNSNSIIKNIHTTGQYRAPHAITGNANVGGLVGQNSGTIQNDYSTANVKGNTNVGGLVGQNSGMIKQDHAKGTITGITIAGGLVGLNTSQGTIQTSYAQNPVNANKQVGGLVGQNSGTIQNAYAIGQVSGTNKIGGLVGSNQATISNAYATSQINGNSNANNVGGLVGLNALNATISNAYATGTISAGSNASNVGGLIGNNTGSITHGYWDTNTASVSQGTGNSNSNGITGLSTSALMNINNLSGFNFTSATGSSTTGSTGNNWVLVDQNGTLNNANNASGATLPMLASEYSQTIQNSHQLQLMAMAPQANYTLNQDIQANGTGKATSNSLPNIWSQSGFVPIGNKTQNFTGSLNGKGHIVKNLTINQSNQNRVGLLGSVSNSTVQNIGLINENITGQNNVGGLIGYDPNSQISNTYVTGSISGTSNVGGLIGQITSNTTLNNSYSTANVQGTTNIGGIAGLNQGTIKDVYATGQISGTNNLGGLVGQNNSNGLISNAYATGIIKGSSNASNTGGLIGSNNGHVVHGYWDQTTAGITSGVGNNNSNGVTGLTTSNLMNTNGPSGLNFTTQTGQSGNNWVLVDQNGSLNNAGFNSVINASGATLPMLSSEYSQTIQNAHQLQLMAMNYGADYSLATNINASATKATTTNNQPNIWDKHGFVPVGNNKNQFSGQFNGLGHTINNLYINRPNNNNVGLFRVTDGSVLNNAGLIKSNITGQKNVGAWVGRNTLFDKIQNIYANGKTTVNSNGQNILTTLKQGSNSNHPTVGGIIGSNNGIILNSVASNQVVGSASSNKRLFSGGLIGVNHGEVINDHTSGSNIVSVKNNYGSNSSNSVKSFAGGLIGENARYGHIVNSYSSQNVTTNATHSSIGYLGGLAGSNNGTIFNDYATGNVKATSSNHKSIISGGLVGLNNSKGTINSNYAKGAIQTSNGSNFTYSKLYSGGLVGKSKNLISNSYATGSVTVKGNHVDQIFVGGLVGKTGHVNGKIKNSYAMGNVIGDGSHIAGVLSVGGLVGVSKNIISNSYAKGNVTGKGQPITLSGGAGPDDNYFTGGLAGINGFHAYISNSYATGNVLTQKSDVNNIESGGLVGLNKNNITKSYATGTVTAQGNTNHRNLSGGLVGLNNKGTLTQDHATGKVVSKGTNTWTMAGGFVGQTHKYGGTISKSYATGNVVAKGSNNDSDIAGGFVGDVYNLSYQDDYATGNVKAKGNKNSGLKPLMAGGFVGNMYGGTISNAYATGNVSVTGSNYSNSYSKQHIVAGGFAGAVGYNKSITNAYAAKGSLNFTGTNDVSLNFGGFAGYIGRSATINNGYWDKTKTGFSQGYGTNKSASSNISVTGLTISQMKQQSNYSGFSIGTSGSSNTWYIYQDDTTPMLNYFLSNITVSGGPTSSSFKYGKTIAQLLPAYTYSKSSAPNKGHIQAIVGKATLANGKPINAGTNYTTDFYSNQQGYRITVKNNPTYSITPKQLRASITSHPSKTYDASNQATIAAGNTTLKGFLNNQGATSKKITGTYSQSGAGTNLKITANLSASNFNPNSNTTLSNYVIPNSVSTTGTIKPKQLTSTISGNPTKTYNGTNRTTIAGSNVSLNGFVGSQGGSISSKQLSAQYSQANVGSNIKVIANINNSNISAQSNTSLSNYNLPSKATGTFSGTGTIQPKQLTANFGSSPTKTYNGTNGATISSGNINLNGFVSNQGATSKQVNGTYAQSGAGSNIKVSANISSSNFSPNSNTTLSNYTMPNSVSGTGVIKPKQLTANILNNPTKTYNGTNGATIGSGNVSLSGFVGSQGASASTQSVSGTYAQSSAGSNIQMTAQLSGSDFKANSNTSFANYKIPSQTAINFTGIGTIKPKSLTANFANAPTKTYNGTNGAIIASGNINLNGFVGNQGATSKQTSGSYAQASAGKNIKVSASISGSNFNPNSNTTLSNYTIPSSVSSAQGVIKPKQLTANILNNPTKIYNGTNGTTIAGSNVSLNGFVGSQGGSISSKQLSAQYSQANAGSNIKVVANINNSNVSTQSNTSLSNYSLPNKATGTFSGTGTIQPKQLTANFGSSPTKTYNGTNGATIKSGNINLNGFVGNQGATSKQVSGTYAQSGAGSNIKVSANISSNNFNLNSNTSFANYNIPNSVSGTGIIKPKQLTANILNNPTKTYNGTNGATIASGNINLNGFVGNQGATSKQVSGNYAQSSAGNNIKVSANLSNSNFNPNSNTTLSNYTIPSSVSSAQGVIKPKQLTANILNNPTKVYNGTNNIAIAGSNISLGGFVNNQGGSISSKQVSGQYSQANAGSNISVSANIESSNVSTQSNTSLGNYNLPSQATGSFSGTGTIKPKHLSAQIIGNPTKTYNGTNNTTIASGNINLNGFIGNQGAQSKQVKGTYAQSNVGNNIKLTVPLNSNDFVPNSNTSLNNYQIPNSVSGTGAIKPKHSTQSTNNPIRYVPNLQESGPNSTSNSNNSNSSNSNNQSKNTGTTRLQNAINGLNNTPNGVPVQVIHGGLNEPKNVIKQLSISNPLFYKNHKLNKTKKKNKGQHKFKFGNKLYPNFRQRHSQ